MSTLLVTCTICGKMIAQADKVSFSQADINSYAGCSCETDGTASIQITVDSTPVLFVFPPVDMEHYVSDAIVNARTFGNALIVQFSAENVLSGFTTEQLDTTLATLSDVMDALKAGAIAIALARLSLVTPDGIIITTQRLAQYANYMTMYLGS